MGLLSVHGENLDVIQKQVWLPGVEQEPAQGRYTSQGVYVYTQPHFKERFEKALEIDPQTRIFELNKAVKGPNGVVLDGRAGFVMRRPVTEPGIAGFDAHLPARLRMFDIGSMAKVEINLPEEKLHESERRNNLHVSVAALAIQGYVNGTLPYKEY